MTGKWSIIIPETAAVTNLITNPSAETATTGYAARSGGTLAASSAKQRRGYQSLSYTSTTATTDGLYYDAVAVTSGTAYTAAFDFWGADTIPYTAFFATTGGTAVDDAITWTGEAGWTRKVVTHSASASTNFRLYIAKNTSESVAPFYVDGVGVYAADHDPQHIDGDQEDCYWNGTPHASTSTRLANSANGGEAINFDDYNFYISEWPGAGMVELDPFTLPYTLLPGSVDAGEKIVERSFSLVGTVIGTSLPDLHAKRKALIGAMKPGQKVWLVYSGGSSSRPVRIRCKYIGGLSMGSQRGFSEQVALKFLAVDPFWYEDGDEGTSLTTYGTDADANYAVKYLDGVWSAVNSSFNQIVYAIAKGLDGAIYYGGAFTGLTGSTTGDYIAKFATASSTAPVTVDNGMAGGNVYSLVTSPNGNIYAGGAFTLAGGRANTVRVAYYDGTQWQPLSTGIAAGQVNAMAFGTNGTLYIGGTFTNHGDANGDYVTSWTGSAFASLSTGADGAVEAIAAGPDGSVYVGGAFTTIGGVTVTGIAKWNGSAFSALSTGAAGGTATVYALAVGPNGYLYAGGNFTSMGGVTAANIARWTGAAWEALGDGASFEVYKLAFDQDGLLWAMGNQVYQVWNGATWVNIEANFGDNAVIRALLLDGDNRFIGSSVDIAAFSYKNTVTNNATADVYPKLVIKRSGGTSAQLRYLKNYTTGDTVWFDYSLASGETLTVDFHPLRRSVKSSHWGSVIGRAVERNSDFASFHLAPGTNYVGLYVYEAGTPTMTAYMYYPMAHYSLDGSAT